jgi:hypothetical protein
MAVVVVAPNRSFFDRAVHSFDLTIGPRVVWLGRSVLDPVYLADHVEAHLSRICCVLVARLLRELGASIHCPLIVCVQTMSIRIVQGCILAHFLRSRRRGFAMTSSLRMIAVIASFLLFPDATN